MRGMTCHPVPATRQALERFGQVDFQAERSVWKEVHLLSRTGTRLVFFSTTSMTRDDGLKDWDRSMIQV